MWQRVRNSPDWHFVGLVLLIAVVLQLLGPEYFRYNSDWLKSGQIWRIVSAHWVHVGWAHLALNYWPDRVREKWKTDKSLSIAHNLEQLYDENN